jgi:hypothetical protein
MINVAMRIEQQFNVQGIIVNKICKLRLFVRIIASGINDYTFIRLIIHYIGILLKWIKHK